MKDLKTLLTASAVVLTLGITAPAIAGETKTDAKKAEKHDHKEDSHKHDEKHDDHKEGDHDHKDGDDHDKDAKTAKSK